MFYAVKKGKHIGVFNSWEECRENIQGVSGAIYKKFKTLEEAECFAGLINEVSIAAIDKKEEDIKENEIVFYVDGSFNSKTKTVGYGVVLVVNNKVIIRDLGSSHSLEDVSQRNVLGEIKAAIKACDLAIANGYKEITIVYDYDGIEYWATDKWKAKTQITTYYKKAIQSRMKHIRISFVNVKSHSNVKWNDEADRLAKIGAGL